jgi:hypothetical protein
MVVLSTLRQSVGALKREPVLVPLLVLAGLPFLAAAVLGHSTEHPAITGSVLSVLLSPFVLGGSYGVAAAALDGRDVTPGAFLAHGAGNYLAILLATLALYAAIVAVVFVSFVLFLVPILNVVVVGLLVAFAILVTFGTQFYDVALVVGDEDVLGAFDRSYAVMKHNFLSVVGYTVVRAGIVLAVAWLVGPAVVGSIPVTLTNGPAGTGLAVTVPFVAPVFAVVLYPYHVAFFQRVERGPGAAEEAYDDPVWE